MRVAKRLPRKTLAAKAGINVSYLAALERGSRNPPSAEKLEKILDGLGTTPKERERLQQVAFFTRLKIQISEGVPLHILEATEVVASIHQLTVGEIRVVKAVIDAIVANHVQMEAQM